MLFKERFKIRYFARHAAYMPGAIALLWALSIATGCASSTKRATSTGVAAINTSAGPNQGQDLAGARPLIIYPESYQYSARKNPLATRYNLDTDPSIARARYRESPARDSYAAQPGEVAKHQLLLQKRGPYPLGVKGKNRDPYLEMLTTNAKLSANYHPRETGIRQAVIREDSAKAEPKEDSRRYSYNIKQLSNPGAVEAARNNYTDRPYQGLKDRDLKQNTSINHRGLIPETRGLAKYEVAAKKNTAVSAAIGPVIKPKLPDSEPKDTVVKSKSQQPAKDPPKEIAKHDSTPQLKARSSDAPSLECKKALKERDIAAQTEDRSSKLFHIRRALRLCPNSAPLHHDLGQIYLSMDRDKDAEDEFKQALSIDPNFSASKRSLSTILKDEAKF